MPSSSPEICPEQILSKYSSKFFAKSTVQFDLRSRWGCTVWRNPPEEDSGLSQSLFIFRTQTHIRHYISNSLSQRGTITRNLGLGNWGVFNWRGLWCHYIAASMDGDKSVCVGLTLRVRVWERERGGFENFSRLCFPLSNVNMRLQREWWAGPHIRPILVRL